MKPEDTWRQLMTIGGVVIGGMLCLWTASAMDETSATRLVFEEVTPAYELLYQARALDEEDLLDWLDVQRRFYDRITPPGFSWIQPVGLKLFSRENFPSVFWEGLTATYRNGVALYPLIFPGDPHGMKGSGRVGIQIDLLDVHDAWPYLYVQTRVENPLLMPTGGTSGGQNSPAGNPDFQINHFIRSNGNYIITVTNGMDFELAELFIYPVEHVPGEKIVVWTNEYDEVITQTNAVWNSISPSYNGLQSEWQFVGYIPLTNGTGTIIDAGRLPGQLIGYYAATGYQHSDADGLSDGMEIFVYKTDPYNADTDDDGVDDDLEIQLGCNPLAWDTDGDGMPDGWEIQYGTKVLIPDALEDPDCDFLPNIYEYHHGTDPYVQDAESVERLQVGSGGNYSTLQSALSASEPYSIIEMLDGEYAYSALVVLPAHPILLTSENLGPSRMVVLNSTASVLFSAINEQTPHTILRGFTIRLAGTGNTQYGILAGSPDVWGNLPGAALTLDGIIFDLGDNRSNIGVLYRGMADEPAIINNCVFRAKRGLSEYNIGLYAVNSPDLKIYNCTFLNFPPDISAFGVQLESNIYNDPARTIKANFYNCLWDQTFLNTGTAPFVRLEHTAVYQVSMYDSLSPRAFHPAYIPDEIHRHTLTPLQLALGGHQPSNTFSICIGGAPWSWYDFEGEARLSLDIGADEHHILDDSDADGDCISKSDEIMLYFTDPYSADSDRDGISDGREVLDGTNPADNGYYAVSIQGILDNQTGLEAPFRATYGFGATGTAHPSSLIVDDAFTLPIIASNQYLPLWVHVFADLNTNTFRDVNEPLYSQQPIISDQPPPLTFVIWDADGDGVSDGKELLDDTNPVDAGNYSFTVQGSFTNESGSTAPVYVGTSWGGAISWMPAFSNQVDGFTRTCTVVNGTAAPMLHVYCDFNTNGIPDANEPLYSKSIIVSDIPFTTSVMLRDYDGDGVADYIETLDGTNPCSHHSYMLHISGKILHDTFFTNGHYPSITLSYWNGEDAITTSVGTNMAFAFPSVRIQRAGGRHYLTIFDDLNQNDELDDDEISARLPITVTNSTLYIPFQVGLDTCDSDRDYMLDFWERRVGLSPTNRLDACEDPDDDYLYNIHEYWAGTAPWTVDPMEYAMQFAAKAVDDRIAGKNPAISKNIFSIQDHANTNYVRNTNCWAADLDLTGCSPWNSEGGAYRAGTLISPRHILFAAHYPISPGATIRFVDCDNNIIEKTITAIRIHPDYWVNEFPDIAIGLLDSDVPTNRLTIYKVLPDNYEKYMHTLKRFPTLQFNRQEYACIGDINSCVDMELNTYPPQLLNRLEYFEAKRAGDSGNPVFLAIDNELILLTVWHGPEGLYSTGTAISDFKTDINNIMTLLGGNYQLQTIDLSIYKVLGE